jgi:hypothetical protein
VSSIRYSRVLTALFLCVTIAGISVAAAVDLNSFHTRAMFSVDKTDLSLSTAVATIEPRLGAPGYSWVRINYYTFPVDAEDLAGILKGDTASMDKKWSKKSSDLKYYNSSYAMLQLSVDQNFKVWQVDLSVPGHGCTVAPFEKDVKDFLQEYQFDGKSLRLKSKGSYVCNMTGMGIPNPTFAWDVDLHAQVFQKQK